MGDVQFFTNAIMGAVVFTLVFLTANTLRQSIHERIPEFAVLTALGYSDGRVLSLAYAEALLLYMPPAALGLLLAYLAAPLAKEDIGAIVVSPDSCDDRIGLCGAARVIQCGFARLEPVSNVSRRRTGQTLSSWLSLDKFLLSPPQTCAAFHLRPGNSLVIVVGMAGVVAVFIAVLAMYAGFRATIQGDGRADRAIVPDARRHYLQGTKAVFLGKP